MWEKRVTLALVMFLLFPYSSWADKAKVLPRGVFSFASTYYHYFDMHKKYDKEGKAVPIAHDYNKDLDGTVFPSLAPLDPLVGGKANIGRSAVEFTFVNHSFDFTLAYGITDRLSVAVYVPYNRYKNEVKAFVDTSRANVGKNARLNTLAPLGLPGTVPLTTQDVQNLLGRGLDINGDGRLDIEGYGYNPIKTWTGDDIGDIQVQGKYQILDRDPWQIAVSGGVRLPTGKPDDPDSLVDLSTGDGQTDVLLRAHLDFLGIKNLCLDGTMRYDIQLPDRRTLRVPPSVHMLLTRYKEKVERKLGDILEFEITGNYNLTSALSGGLRYRFTRKFKDSVDGKMDDAFYASLEDETNLVSHMAYAFITFSTVQMFEEKKFPLPLSLQVEYRNRFAGKNGAIKAQYISVTLNVFF
jgi:hypothetical protein